LLAGVWVAVAPVWGDTAASSLTFSLRCVRRARARREGRRRWRSLAFDKKKGRPGRSAVRARLASLGYNVSCNTEVNVGRRSAGETTNGAMDAQQVDVSTRDEHGVRNTHLDRITHFVSVCPAEVGHTALNPTPGPAIPASAVYRCKDLPVLRTLARATPAGPSSSPARPGPRRPPAPGGADSHTRCPPGSPRGAAYGTRRRSCPLLCPRSGYMRG
jgi:hypothetical protein